MTRTSAGDSEIDRTVRLPRLGHWIDGAMKVDPAAETAQVFDPVLGLPQTIVELADRDTVDAAVFSAQQALGDWSALSLPRRVAIMQSYRTELLDNRAAIIGLISREHGKVTLDAQGEFQRAIEVVEFACSAALLLKGEYSDEVATGVDTYSLRQPVGVCAGITPFNFPAMVPLWMFPIALVCGNTFVLKPSERTPSVALFLAELAADAGIPPGVLNVVNGSQVAVDSLLTHPGVAAISFVGSTPVAKHVYSLAAANGKRVQAFGGAKNHMVVLPDADVEDAADAAVSAAFGSSGQRCMAISAVISVGDIGDALIEAIRSRVEELRPGDHEDPDADFGPLITGEARDRALRYIEFGIDDGAELIVDGRTRIPENLESGFFVGPSIFDFVERHMSIYTDEIFGPVLVHLRVPDLESALELIQTNPYGNGAAVFGRDGGEIRRFVRSASAGMIGVNAPVPVPVAFHSFGGWGDSLFGDQHMYGPEAFNFYTRAKVVTARWRSDATTGINLAFPTHEG